MYFQNCYPPGYRLSIDWATPHLQKPMQMRSVRNAKIFWCYIPTKIFHRFLKNSPCAELNSLPLPNLPLAESYSHARHQPHSHSWVTQLLPTPSTYSPVLPPKHALTLCPRTYPYFHPHCSGRPSSESLSQVTHITTWLIPLPWAWASHTVGIFHIFHSDSPSSEDHLSFIIHPNSRLNAWKLHIYHPSTPVPGASLPPGSFQDPHVQILMVSYCSCCILLHFYFGHLSHHTRHLKDYSCPPSYPH